MRTVPSEESDSISAKTAKLQKARHEIAESVRVEESEKSDYQEYKDSLLK